MLSGFSYRLQIVIFGLSVVLSGCSIKDSLQKLKRNDTAVTASVADDDTAKPVMRDAVGPPLQNTGHITVAEAAKVSDAELKQATAKPIARPERDLGKTVASLGLIDETGFWLQTPLVQSPVDGRIIYLKTGTSINLRLLPNGQTAGSGSQISIAAMKVLGISIVDLVEVQVYIR